MRLSIEFAFLFFLFLYVVYKTPHESFADRRLTNINLPFARYVVGYYDKFSITKMDTELYFPMWSIIDHVLFRIDCILFEAGVMKLF